jgi:DNA-binding winged helix-turn-helix (wHTH) protein/tetratricopeptide (TPR) repeat protein
MTQQSKHLYEFGPYRIDPAKRVLSRGEEAVQLPSKVFETLLVLVQHSEEVVSKDDLLKTVWPDSFVEESNLSQSIFLLRKALGETAQDHRYIVTIPGRGYRFAEKVRSISPAETDLIVETHSQTKMTVEETEPGPEEGKSVSFLRPHKRPWSWILPIAALLLVVSGLLLHRSRPTTLGAGDLVLVSDFVNTTGEPVFDGSLKQALTVKLAESPYFNIVPDSQTRNMLSLMGRSPYERVVPPIARDVCQRAGAKVVVGGSILSVGNKYVLDLDATNCFIGANLAHREIEAPNQEQVLNKLGQLIPSLRRKLGESVSSIQKFDTPIEQATTKSLAALKAYTSGDQKRTQGSEPESIASYKMAIELDPDFAIAYARLGAIYSNLQQLDLSEDYFRQAFERRAHVSEREKFYIQAHYYDDVTRESDKSIETYKLWAEVYPHDAVPFNNLAMEYIGTGELDKAIDTGRQALRLNPTYSNHYGGLARVYLRASHFAEAKALCEKAVTEKLDNWSIHDVLYEIAFVEDNESDMQREIEWFKGKPTEGWNTRRQAMVALSRGELKKSRQLFERARAITLQQGLKELAAGFTEDQARYEADLENRREATVDADLALRMMPNSAGHKVSAAVAFARAADLRRAEALIRELNKLPSLGTDINHEVIPSIRAAMELARKNPAAAVEDLRAALPYDLGTPDDGTTMYYRGLAYLELKDGKNAAAQFQKILDNRGVVTTDIYWPLAHLGLARSYVMTADIDESLAHYREFLTLWKSADPDLGILKQAKAEYATLSKPTP